MEVAWVAGLLEGEGCFCTKTGGAQYVNCSMTDEDVVRKLHAIVGRGYVTTTPPRGLGRKRVWTWRMGGREDVKWLCETILPYMGLRRSQRISEVIYNIENRPPLRAKKAEMIHGIRRGYSKGCRCDLCKRSEALYVRDLKERRKTGNVGRPGVATTTLAERIARGY